MTDWIDRTERLDGALQDAPAILGIDTEFMRIDTFHPKLALVQLIIRDHVVLVDPAASINLDALGRVLADPQRLIVMHSASEDLEALATRMPQGLGHLFDTQIAAAFAGMGAGLGYQKLVAELTGVALPKGETRSDWLKRPLSALQIEYAAQDVIHLPELHAQLSTRMEQRGYADWHAQDCARMVERARHRQPDPEPQLGLRGATGWPREAQALLRRVLLWRDATARVLDRPRPWLLDDARALDLSARVPADENDLFERCKGLRALRGAQRAELLQVVQAPLRSDELDFPPIPPAPGPREKKALAALKEVVNERAATLDLPEGLLCARRHLETLLMTGQWPDALEGWRREVLFDALMERLPSANGSDASAQ